MLEQTNISTGAADAPVIEAPQIGYTLEQYSEKLHNALLGEEALAQALKDLVAEVHLSKLNIRKDFSLINAHAAATKALWQFEKGDR